jgi:hypothetical protein
MKKNKKNTPKLPKEESLEWDLTEDFGLFPKDIPLTQNIGCAGGKPDKSKKDNPEAKK